MNENQKNNRSIYLIVISLIISGILLLADAVHFYTISKLTVRLGVGLIFSAIALLVGRNRPAGIIATAIIWIAIIITFFN